MSDFTSPRNTAASEPIEKLLTAMEPNGIVNQEAQGQRELVNSQVLPSEILHDTQADFEALGFVFGGQVEGDPMFRDVTLPEGWKREGSDHHMWSYILDTRGIRRVAIFYKAAFYDRSAHMSLSQAGYSLTTEWIYGDDEELKLHPELTREELLQAQIASTDYIKRSEEHPEIYADRRPRAERLLEDVNALL